MPLFDADNLIAAFGDDAYWRAVELTVHAIRANDDAAAAALAAGARELLRRGYHRKGGRPPRAAPG